MRTFDKIIGYLALSISTVGFAGMLMWLLGKPGKGGGTISSVLTTLVLVAVYSCNLSFGNLLVAAVLMLLIGIPTVKYGEQFMLRRWGARKRHTGETVTHDFNETCIDEVHGMLIAALPIYFVALPFWQFVTLHVVALIAFRIFDGKKIGPVKYVENAENLLTIPGAIMLDDSVAGLMAAGLVTLGLFIIQAL